MELIGEAKVVVRTRVQAAIPTSGGERQGALGVNDVLSRRAPAAAMV
jgi:hypothetical protein